MVRHRDRRTITAADVRDLASACYAQLSSGALPPVERSRTSRRVQLAAAAVALAVVASGIAWWAQRNSKVRWARQEALPEIIRLADADKFDAAYTLAQQAQPYIPDDPLLAEQIRGIARGAVIDSDPAGADVFYRPYGRSDEPWRPLGKTPVAGATVPRGLLHWKGQLAGHEISGGRRTWPVRVDDEYPLRALPTGQGPGRHGPNRIAQPDVPDRHAHS